MIADKLKELPAITESSEQKPEENGCHWWHEMARESAPTVAQFFFDEGYVLEMLTCEDFLDPDSKFRLVYQFNKWGENDRHRIYVDVPDGEKGFSIASIYESANWYEREVYDMYGVKFENHPYMERILMPEDSEWHPLLKKFNDPSTMPAEETSDAS